MREKATLSDNELVPGATLKRLRVAQGLTLVEVSERTGISVSTLSKVENGKMAISMDRLLRISLALNVNIVDIIGTSDADDVPSGDRRKSVTRRSDEVAVDSNLGRMAYHAHDILEKSLTPLVAEITARSIEEFGEFHRHAGEEWVLVLSGELALHTDTYAPVRLKEGESIYFDSGMGHAYVAIGEEPCRIASVFSKVSSKGMKTFAPVSEVAAVLQRIAAGTHPEN